MPQTGFGTALKTLRNRRTLSQRELAELTGVDNAYINRLESGEKTNPTGDAITKLSRGLKPSERDAGMLRWLADHPDAWPDLVEYVLERPEIPLHHFVAAAGVQHRGSARPTPEVLMERVKRLYEEDGP